MINIVIYKEFMILFICSLFAILFIFTINLYSKRKLLSEDRECVNLDLLLNELSIEGRVYKNIKIENSKRDIENMVVYSNYILVKKIFRLIINNIDNNTILFKVEHKQEQVLVTLWNESKVCNYNLLQLIKSINEGIFKSNKIKIAIEGKSNLGTKIIIKFT